MLREPRQVPKSTLLADSLKQSESLPLLVSGQGVFIFRSEKESLEGMNVVFLNKDGTDGVDFLLTSTGVTATRTESRDKYIDPDNVSGLTDLPGAYYWISLDSQNQRFYVGVGEARAGYDHIHIHVSSTRPKGYLVVGGKQAVPGEH